MSDLEENNFEGRVFNGKTVPTLSKLNKLVAQYVKKNYLVQAVLNPF